MLAVSSLKLPGGRIAAAPGNTRETCSRHVATPYHKGIGTGAAPLLLILGNDTEPAKTHRKGSQTLRVRLKQQRRRNVTLCVELLL
jgi:hypothetical protein